MSIAACAALLEKGDPDRHLAVMAAPVAARARLFPLYAFNLEVARAPWVTKEPMIAEMRLQWWRDAVENAQSGAARAHEVAGPLHQVIHETGLPLDAMDRLIAARRHDCWGQGFDSAEGFAAYIEDTGAGLMWLAARALDAPDRAEPVARAYGWAAGLANYLMAVPELTARGRMALPDASAAAISALAEQGLARLALARKDRAALPRAVAPALLAGWQAAPLLRQVARDPAAVAEGRLHLSEFSRRGRLLWQAASGRW